MVTITYDIIVVRLQLLWEQYSAIEKLTEQYPTQHLHELKKAGKEILEKISLLKRWMGMAEQGLTYQIDSYNCLYVLHIMKKTVEMLESWYWKEVHGLQSNG